jgi:hypothetical protein
MRVRPWTGGERIHVRHQRLGRSGKGGQTRRQTVRPAWIEKEAGVEGESSGVETTCRDQTLRPVPDGLEDDVSKRNGGRASEAGVEDPCAPADRAEVSGTDVEIETVENEFALGASEQRKRRNNPPQQRKGNVSLESVRTERTGQDDGPREANPRAVPSEANARGETEKIPQPAWVGRHAPLQASVEAPVETAGAGVPRPDGAVNPLANDDGRRKRHETVRDAGGPSDDQSDHESHDEDEAKEKKAAEAKHGKRSGGRLATEGDGGRDHPGCVRLASKRE